MFLRSTLRLVSSQYTYASFLSPTSIQLEHQRPFMFWRANVNRELYGTPNKAAATRKRRRLQKSLTQIIREGQLWRFLKEAYLPDLKKLWNEVQPWDRR